MVFLRVENLEAVIKIPFEPGKPDRNGLMYDEKAIEEACKNVSNIPFIIKKDGVDIPIGNVKKAEYVSNQNGIFLRCALFAGGTSEIADLDNSGVVNSVQFSSMGIEV